MDKNTAILVTGGTGFLGSYLLRYLIREGYSNIRATRRPSSSMQLVAAVADRVEWVEADILDVIALEDAFQGIQRVFHSAAMISFNPRKFKLMHQINGEGTANVVNIALSSGIEKLVHVGSIAAIGRPKNGSTLSEKTKWQQHKVHTEYGISKYVGEREAWRAAAEGLNIAIALPGVILGSGNWDEGPQQMLKYAWQSYPFYPSGTSGFVDVRDVARFLLLLMESDIQGERFIVSSDNYSYKKILSLMAQALDRKAPTIKISPFIRALAWRYEWLLSKFTSKPAALTKETARDTASTYYYDNQKSRDQLSFEYTPIQQTIEQMAGQFAEASRDNFAPRVLPLI